jgi:molybdate-binding protein
MARYIEIASHLAQRIRSGDLPPGTDLPAVRAYSAELGATSSTIVRAYRHLADAGIITVADRRRARVATGGAIAAARLLEADRIFRLAGSDDPALQILLDHAKPAIVPVGARGSFQALRALARGTADGAAIHLRHRNGDYNTPFAHALLHNDKPHLLHLWRREQGLLVPQGNPRDLHSAADLTGLLVARREQGAGTRILLDQLLIAENIQPHHINGPELHSHLEIALAVATGVADAGLGIRAHTVELGLDFVPLTWESYDIALRESALGAVQPLLTATRDEAVQASINRLGGYDLTDAGTIRPLHCEANCVQLSPTTGHG